MALCCACAPAFAQTTARNTMPDGSKDVYLGLGVESLPRFEGSGEQRTIVAPVVQMQWSNGIFWNGMSVGMHLSTTPGIEYGPLFAFEPGRGSTHSDIIGVNHYSSNSIVIGHVPPPAYYDANLSEVGPRPEFGGFFNYYFSEKTRVTTDLLYGAGEHRDGLKFTMDLQHTFAAMPAHHSLAISAGFSAINRQYDQSYFGINDPVPSVTGLDSYSAPPYVVKGGVMDTHAAVHWNWELSNSWLLTSGVQITHLAGAPAESPLTDKRSNATVYTGLAYRF